MFIEKTHALIQLQANLSELSKKTLGFVLNQIISALKQMLMMVEIFTTLVDTALLKAYQIVQPFLDFVLAS